MGLYYDVDLAKADEYYRKAIKYGNLQAYDNMLAAHFRLWEDDCIEILLLGYAGEYPDAKWWNLLYLIMKGMKILLPKIKCGL